MCSCTLCSLHRYQRTRETEEASLAANNRRGRRVVDNEGNPVPTAPYAFAGPHTNLDVVRFGAIMSDTSKFTKPEKLITAWFIANSPAGMEPVYKTAVDISADIKMDSDTYGKAIRVLKNRRVVIPVGKIGRTALYRISPYISFIGSGLEQREAIKAWNPPSIPGLEVNESTWRVA
jgi:hypothetical protein